VCGDEWIHERLEIRPPPLRQGVADFPFVVYAFTRELRSNRGKPLIQPVAESCEFLFMWVEVIAWSVKRRLIYMLNATNYAG